MSNTMLRAACRLAPRRTLSTSTILSQGTPAVAVDHSLTFPMPMTQEHKDEYYPKLGNRDIVCFGASSSPNYLDIPDYPMPAVRFGENTPDIVALREKEKGPWQDLTLIDKKKLYRHSYRQTLAEVFAPTGERKRILTGMIWGCLGTLLMLAWADRVLPNKPRSITDDWQDAQQKRMIREGRGKYRDQYDYQTGEWKK